MTTQDRIEGANLAWVTMDCGDPVRLSTFWSAVLGVAEGGRIADPPQYVMLEGQAPRQVLQFQRVTDANLPRNRLHLDLVVDDVDSATVRVEQLGGSRKSDSDFDEAGYRWRVMADPEGNEFCLVHQLGKLSGGEATEMNRRTVDDLVIQARARLDRVAPQDLLAEQAAGALLVDIRLAERRDRDGQLPGAIVIDRNVLEWRLDPASPHRRGDVAGYDQRIILVCNEGCSSSLAAATLQDLGLHRATDLIGGYQGWVRSATALAAGTRPTDRDAQDQPGEDPGV